MSLFVAVLIGILSVVLPGIFLSLALLKKTKMALFEIAVIGIIFGLVFPPTLTWFESYFMNSIHQFAFSEGLYNVNVVIITIVGILLCFQQGVFSHDKQGFGKNVKEGSFSSLFSRRNLGSKLVKEHEKEEKELAAEHKHEESMLTGISAEEKSEIESIHKHEEKELEHEHEKEESGLLDGKDGKQDKNMKYVWIVLALLMLFALGTRIMNIAVAPHYFEFDPYFDMISTEYILVHGYQLFLDHSAWPVVAAGTLHRIEPIVPYLEAYWYDLANTAPASSTAVSTNLLSYVGSVYPPITAALLVFVVFMWLYHQYGKWPGIVGAVLAASMPALISTFIAGEQLVEPWGIFAMFFFFASYMLAVSNPKQKRYAVLAGVAFASNFLGAHYYIVPTGILSIYIILQGIVNVMRNQDNTDFYKMNGILLLIIIISYGLYAPYGGTLTNSIPNIFNVIPITIGFPLAAFIFVLALEYIPKLLKKNGMIKELDWKVYLAFLAVLVIIALGLIFLTSFGSSIRGYITISERFTTPSKPLFMTVQEYEPTGFNYNFGAAGFGVIGTSIPPSGPGINLVIWIVLIAFTALELLAIYYRRSVTSIFAIASVWPLAIAGMIEIKYLPHFGVGYIIAIGIIIGELMLIARRSSSSTITYSLYVVGYLLLVLAVMNSNLTLLFQIISDVILGLLLGVAIWFASKEYKWVLKPVTGLIFVCIILMIVEFMPSASQLFSAAINSNCNSLESSGNAIGAGMFCNTVPQYWLNATAWMRTNVGPFGPRILSWWDYGDWINWFGNSNAVLRGDNSVATEDYATAAQYVFGANDGYNASELASFMDQSQAKYILFDDQLVPKWGALDFLACIDVNQTSMQFATATGKKYGVPYALGYSQCEISHSPAYLLVPITNNVNAYCSFSNSTMAAINSTELILPDQFTNTSYCVSTAFIQEAAQEDFQGNLATRLYYSNGTESNVWLSTVLFEGEEKIGSIDFLTFMELYAPNGPNDTITNAPSEFYNSTYYKGYFLGSLPGMSLAYPSNVPKGINYINYTQKIMIYQLNNFSGTLPTVTPKPSWIKNNYTMPG